MSDIHRLPLLGHDMPYYLATFDEPEIRAKVYSRRLVTGQLRWYFRMKTDDVLSPLVHGPYMSAEDANKAAEDQVELLT